MKTVTSANIDEFKNADCAVLDFWATWCGPCKMMSPIVESLAEKYADRVKFGSVNVDEEEGLAMSFDVSVIPTLFFLKDGKTVNKTVGVRSAADLEEIIEGLLK